MLKLLSVITRVFNPAPRVEWTVSASESGFRFCRGSEIMDLRWSNVVRAEGWVLDLLTTDCIYIDLTDAADGVWQIHEEMPGYDRLKVSLREHLVGIDLEALGYFVNHALSRRRILLWERQSV